MSDADTKTNVIELRPDGSRVGVDAGGRRHYRMRAETAALGLEVRQATVPEFVGVVLHGLAAERAVAILQAAGIEVLSVEEAKRTESRKSERRA
jgi:predicted Fe-Mo cluster-binding NifX family protein